MRRWLEAGALAALLAGVAVLLAGNALRRLDVHDMGFTLDAGYRILLGQRPYTDFGYFAPPLHPAMHAAFFAVFGFTRTAIQAHLIVLTVLLTLALYAALRRALPAWLTLGVAAVTAVALHGPLSFPWMDGNAWFWLSLAFAWLLAHVPLASPRATVHAAVLGGVAVALAALVKANVGAFGGLAYVAVLLVGPFRWRAAAVFVAATAATLAAILLPWIDVPEMIAQVFVASPSLRRLTDWPGLRAALGHSVHTTLAAAGLVPAALGGWTYLRARKELSVMFTGITIAALLSAWTGSMMVAGNIASLGLQAGLLAVLLFHLPTGGGGRLAMVRRASRYAGPALATALLLYVAVDQTRRLPVWDWRPSNTRSDHALTTPAFAGWHMPARYGHDVDAAVPVIKDHVRPHETLMVFADMGFLYGLTGRRPYRGLPVGFDMTRHRGYPQPGPYTERFAREFAAEPPDYILLHEPFELRDGWNPVEGMRRLGILEYVRSRYTEAWRTGDLVLLRRT